MTLTDIQPLGNVISSTLPTTHFDYVQKTTPCCPDYPPEDWGHLWYVNNGYGGKIGFYYDAAGGDSRSWTRRVRAKRVKDGFDTLPDDPPHSVAYFYDYLGGAFNDQAHSLELDPLSIHSINKEFRGFGWVRVQDPMGQVTDHYFSQDDVFKGDEWRAQTGKAPGYSDGFDTTPTATPNPNWTLAGSVALTGDPDKATNGVWQLAQGATITRSVGLDDGGDVSVRFRVEPQAGHTPKRFDGTWKLVAANGDYWGVQFYPVLSSGVYVFLPQAIWSVGGTSGTRDLSVNAPFTPRWLGPLATARWYRLQLHTSPDGRFALELYEDRTDSVAHKAYVQIKSGDAADSGSIPFFPVGQEWQFTQHVTTGDGYVALADDYSETRTIYAQTDSTYQDQTHIQATDAVVYHGWDVSSNRCKDMTIRFVPLTKQVTSLYGTGTELGQTKQSKKTSTYDDYGNSAEVDEYGDVNLTGDERSTISAYATLSTTTSYIVDKVAQVSVYQGIGGSATLMAETRSYYDNQALYDIITGDLTKSEQVGVSSGTPTADRSATQFAYDDYGNQISQTDPDNHQPTITTYDSYYHAFSLQVTHPNGRGETMQYDYTIDALAVMTDMNGLVTHHTVDAFGRPDKTWIEGFGTSSNPNERYTFDDLTSSNPLTAPFYISYQKLLTGTQTTWETRWYDGLGRQIQDVTPAGDNLSSITVDTTYTNTGVLSSTTQPYFATNNDPIARVTPDTSQPKTIHYYDGAGRPSMVVNPDSSQVVYNYGLLQWVATQDESGHIRSQHTDLLGRVDQVKEYGVFVAGQVLTGYGYDVLDRLAQVTRDQGGALETTSTVSYDSLGRKNQVADPDLGTWSYESDLAGNVVTQTDALGQQLLFSYDDMNRMTAKYYGAAHKAAGTPDVKYYYDNTYLGDTDAAAAHSWGRLRNVEVPAQAQPANANGHGYIYDPRGLPAADVVTTTYSTQVYTMTYAYDVGGRLTSLIYPDPTGQEQVSVGYNTQGAGLPQSLTSSVPGNSAPVAQADYNPRGQLTTMLQGALMAGNLLTTTVTYDDATTKRGWLTRTQVVTSTATLLDLNVGYATNGDVSSLTQLASGPDSPVFTNTYTYDYLDRLASASSNLFANESYSFDTLGRMTTRVIGGSSYSYAYTDTAHIDAPTSYRGNAYAYDANGSQNSGVVAGRNETRTFDPEHRLAEVSTTGVSTATVDFIYDGNGKRVLQSVTGGGGTTRTLYVGNLYEEQLTGGSAPYIVYYYLGDRAVGLRRANWATGGPNGQERLVGDHLGSMTLLVDISNPPTVLQRQYYTPYGESAFQYIAAGSLTSRDFTGQRLDGDTGLHDYGARYYDSGLAYFVAADPTVPDPSASVDYNRYSYVRNNPLRYLDALGYSPEDYYVFVNGCSASSGSDNCGGDQPGWGEYLAYLHQEYDQWKQQSDLYSRRYGEDPLPSWERWAYGPNGNDGHVRFVHAPSSVQGASNLANKLAGIPNDGGSIHLIGHSYGGAAILYYLYSRMYRDKYGDDYTADQPIDPRIKSVALIDSDTDSIAELYPGISGEALTAWLESKTRIASGGILQVTASKSVFPGAECISGFDCRDADYSRRTHGPYPPGPGDAIGWHSYTFSNVYGSNFENWFGVWWQ